MFWKDKKKKFDKKTLRVVNNVLEKGLIDVLNIGPKDLNAEGVDFRQVLMMIRSRAQMTLDFVHDYAGEAKDEGKQNGKNGKQKTV